MNWLVSIYTAFLFFIFSADTLFKIDLNDNIYTTAAIHSIIFALVLHYTYKLFWGFSMFMGLNPLNFDLEDKEIESKFTNLFKNYFNKKKEGMQNMTSKEGLENMKNSINEIVSEYNKKHDL